MRENRVIEVEELKVCFRLDKGVVVNAVKGVSFHSDKGETGALVGQSGSGKSVTAPVVDEVDRKCGWRNCWGRYFFERSK